MPKVLIRGLEAGSAYLAYLLRESGYEVDLLTSSPWDPAFDIPPFEPLFTLDFIKDILAVRLVDSPKGPYDVVVDSCDMAGFEKVKEALAWDKPVYVVGDIWLSASLSLTRSLPVPNVDIELPVEKTDNFAEISVRYRPYVGGHYSICGSFKDSWGGCLYTPTRALERIFIAADIYAAIVGLEQAKRRLKLEYAVGKDKAFFAIGCRPEGKLSKINLGEIQVQMYGEEGKPKYVLIQGRPDHIPWILAMYNLARAVDSAFLYDFWPGRGPLNISYLAHLFRKLR